MNIKSEMFRFSDSHENRVSRIKSSFEWIKSHISTRFSKLDSHEDRVETAHLLKITVSVHVLGFRATCLYSCSLKDTCNLWTEDKAGFCEVQCRKRLPVLLKGRYVHLDTRWWDQRLLWANSWMQKWIVVTVKQYSHQTTLQIRIRGRHTGMKWKGMKHCSHKDFITASFIQHSTLHRFLAVPLSKIILLLI